MHIDWKKFGQTLMFVGPVLLPALGVPSDLVNLVVHGVLVAEQAANGDPKSGTEKKRIAMEVVTTALAAIEVVKPGLHDHTPDLLNAVSLGIDATVAAVNAAKKVPLVPGAV